MKVSIIQLDTKLKEKNTNYENAIKQIKKASLTHPDVVVLPELFDVGFFPTDEIEELADNNGDYACEHIGMLAKTLNINIVAGSVMNKRDGNIYNTSYIFNRDGKKIAEYDKMHLFSPMGEDIYFEKGSKICKFKIDGINCGIIICYDLRFPEETRLLSLRGIDVLFVVSQWPDVRVNQLTGLLKGRAIENQCYVVCANACGSANDTKFGGNSSAYTPTGDVLGILKDKKDILNVDIDLSIIRDIRNNINVFMDRRSDLYNLRTI